MNKRQKLIHTFARHMHKAMLNNSSYLEPFSKTYNMIKWSYKKESNEYIKDMIVWARMQHDINYRRE